MYPGSATERAALPLPASLAYFSGMESMAPDASKCGVLPVSPVELDSVLRLARNIRLAAERERTKSYPSRSVLLRRTATPSPRTGCREPNADSRSSGRHRPPK